MTFAERTELVDRLSYEARLAYVAFCVERCLAEARRHETPRAQLANLPLLQQGVRMLWQRATEGHSRDATAIDGVREHLSTYEEPAPDGEQALYRYDVTLVHAARMLAKGLRLLETPDVTARFVAGAEAGPIMTVGLIYRDADQARANELAIVEEALARLARRGPEPPERGMFDDIPDWPRGAVRPVYAEGRLRGTGPEWEE